MQLNCDNLVSGTNQVDATRHNSFLGLTQNEEENVAHVRICIGQRPLFFLQRTCFTELFTHYLLVEILEFIVTDCHLFIVYCHQY